MIHLDANFTLNKYGLFVRLVNENDSEFIMSLRNNPKLSRFIHSTDNDVEKQKEWIRNYKIREKDGLDYYFIYYNENTPIGLNRIYDIHETWATGGSWLCVPGLDTQQSIATSIINRDIMFELLGLAEDRFDVRKGNKHVIKMHKMFGAEITSENEIDWFFTLKSEIYFQKRIEMMELLGIK